MARKARSVFFALVLAFLVGCASSQQRMLGHLSVDVHAVMYPVEPASNGKIRYRMLSHLAGGGGESCASFRDHSVGVTTVRVCNQEGATADIAELANDALFFVEGLFPWISVSRSFLTIVPEGVGFHRLVEKRVPPRGIEIEFVLRAGQDSRAATAKAVEIVSHELTHLAWLARGSGKCSDNSLDSEYREEFVATLVGVCASWKLTGGLQMSVYRDPDSAGIDSALLPSARAARNAAAWLEQFTEGGADAGVERCRKEIRRLTEEEFSCGMD